MTEAYLDITKSVIISSPAGSGKTEKLARRYIALLKGGSEVERILAITFTEKAAAEMKERILAILAAEDPELFASLQRKVPRMRISTIHAFCLKLLKRFSLDLGMDPSLDVTDGFNADLLWSTAIYEMLLDESCSGERLFFCLMKERGVKGWSRLSSVLAQLHAKRPLLELGLSGGVETALACGREALTGETDDGLERIVTLYRQCLDRYRRLKAERHLLDFNDLELLAYEAISRNPEWQNLLYAFDEHTDHILVDEFQDTSTLQWKIIDKLTEEWRAGVGAKTDQGITPSLFLVGDDKQSIYSFRGANVSVFRNARERLAAWLGEDRHHFIEVRENYRSLPAIVTFVNALFEKLMPKDLCEDWRIAYAPFAPTRAGNGSVELAVLESEGTMREGRRLEARLTASRIREITGRLEIVDGDGTRPARYGDMAILLRGRTHLAAFEDSLRTAGIPFVVLKGIGFYQTPEIAVVKSLLLFLIDPLDDYSLLTVLRSPAFGLGYETIAALLEAAPRKNLLCGFLHEALAALHRRSLTTPAQQSLWEPPEEDPLSASLSAVAATVLPWLGRRQTSGYALLLEEILSETGLWRSFHEPQRCRNVKKFIKLVHTYETAGLSALEIREKLIKAARDADEPKANVSTEGMDAVRLMTIHAAKGLQFPVVFLPCLDEESRGASSSSSLVLDDSGERITLAYEDDAEFRKVLPIFQRDREKGAEEEKRLFYVATTRAMDHLFLSGLMNGRKPTGKLAALCEAFGLMPGRPHKDLFSVRWLAAEDLAAGETAGEPSATRQTLPRVDDDEFVFTEGLTGDYTPVFIWRDVTEELETVRRKHGEDWIVLGRAFHSLFEALSRGTVTPDDLEGRAERVLRNETLSSEALARMKAVLLKDLARLAGSDIMSAIILPQERAYTELPFVLQKGGKAFRGRIDRVIVRDGTAFVYDYKTYPAPPSEIPEIVERYRFQLDIYREAVEKLFGLKSRAFIVFTHRAEVVEV